MRICPSPLFSFFSSQVWFVCLLSLNTLSPKFYWLILLTESHTFPTMISMRICPKKLFPFFFHHKSGLLFSLPHVVTWFPLLGLTPSGLFMGSISTLIYTSELILCFTICVLSATWHNIHMVYVLFVFSFLTLLVQLHVSIG